VRTGIGEIHLLAVGREAQSIRRADAFDHYAQPAVDVQAIQPPGVLRAGHRPAEDAPGRVGNHVVEARSALVGYVLDDRGQRPLAPYLDCPFRHEKEQRPVGLEGEPADDLARVALLVPPGRRLVAKHPPGDDVDPVQPPLAGMPQRSLAYDALIVGDQFRLHAQPPYGSYLLADVIIT
jgi:hypothetical protein